MLSINHFYNMLVYPLENICPRSCSSSRSALYRSLSSPSRPESSFSCNFVARFLVPLVSMNEESCLFKPSAFLELYLVGLLPSARLMSATAGLEFLSLLRLSCGPFDSSLSCPMK